MQASIGVGCWLPKRLLGLGLVLLALGLVAPGKADTLIFATTTSVVSSVNPATFPQSETFTATVTSIGGTVNEGIVTFESDTSVIAGCGAQPVSNGTATCTTQLAAGSHSIVAIFNGDVNFQGSSSSTLTQTVNPAVTATQSVATLTFSQGVNGNSPRPPVLGGGGTGSLTYSIAPTLPSGVSINPSTGVVSGLPSVTHAASTFTVTVTDVNSQTASNTFQLTVNPAVATTVAIGSVALTQNRTPTPFVPVTSTGGTAPIGYAISPPLPTGLSFDSTTGTVSGTPSVTHATSSFMVTAVDFWGGTASSNFSLTVNPAVTATQSVSAATLTQNHAATPFTPVTGSGGTGTLSYGVSPPLPTGLSISSTTGAISGTPSVTSSATTYTVTVTDQDGATATNTFSLTVNGPVAAATQIASKGLTINIPATPFTPVTGGGGSTPYAYSVAPGLPTGLTMASATGAITGTPTVVSPSTPYTVTVTDANGATATAGFSLAVTLVTSTTTLASSLNPSQAGQAVTFTATVTGASPTGTVRFLDSGAQIGVATLSGGTARFTTSALALGSHTITASYGGDGNNAASTSSALIQTVATPADSIRLRQMQVMVTPMVANVSGQAITGAIDSAISVGFGGTPPALTPNGSGFTYYFDGSTAGDAASRDSADDGGLKQFLAAPGSSNARVASTFGAMNYAAMPVKAAPVPAAVPRDWLAWIDFRGTDFDRASAGDDFKGTQVNAIAGLTRRITPDFLVGVLGGYEHFDYSSQALNGVLRGDGYTAGTYLGWRLTSHLRFDAAAAWSDILATDTSGLASGTFAGSRWLVSGGFTGSFAWQRFMLEPSARVYALWEHEDAYTDSLGTLQAARNFDTGRASGGAKLSYALPAWSNMALVPYVGLYGDYYFSGDDAVALATTAGPVLEGWSARATGGIAAAFKNGAQLGIGGEFGGLGSDTHIWTGTVRGSLPF